MPWFCHAAGYTTRCTTFLNLRTTGDGKSLGWSQPLKNIGLVCWLVVDLPPWKMMDFVTWDDDIPNWMESHKSHVPKHQPVMIYSSIFVDYMPIKLVSWSTSTHSPLKSCCLGNSKAEPRSRRSSHTSWTLRKKWHRSRLNQWLRRHSAASLVFFLGWRSWMANKKKPWIIGYHTLW